MIKLAPRPPVQIYTAAVTPAIIKEYVTDYFHVTNERQNRAIIHNDSEPFII